MKHFSDLQIQELASADETSAELSYVPHLAECELCRRRLERARHMERALGRLPRLHPPYDLPQRIIASLPASGVSPSVAMGAKQAWVVGVASFIAALLALVFVYQTAFDFQSNGALDLLSMYTSQPAIVTTYPGEALGTLLNLVPWLTLCATLAVFLVAGVLIRQLIVSLGSMGSRLKA